MNVLAVAGGGKLELLVWLVAVAFLLAALWIGVRRGEWIGAIALVFCAVVIVLLL